MKTSKIGFNKRFFLIKDFYAGVIATLFGIFLLISPQKGPTADLLYPHVIFQVIIGVGLFLILKTVLLPQKENIKDLGFKAMEIPLLLILLMAAPAIRVLGMYTAVFAISTITSLLIIKEYSTKAVVKVLIYNVILILLMYVVFTVLLRVITPRGLFI